MTGPAEEADPTEVVQRFGTAWAAHDLETTLQLITEDCRFESTGPAPDGGSHVGRDRVGAAWEPIFADPDTHFEVEETFTSGDRVVQRWRYDWDGGHVRGIDVFRVRDGLVAEKLSYVKG